MKALRLPKLAFALSLALVTMVAGIALALVSPHSAGPSKKVDTVYSTDSSNTNSLTFVQRPGATTTVNVIGTGKQMLSASFNTISSCEGPTGGKTCQVRIMLTAAMGAPQEMQPG